MGHYTHVYLFGDQTCNINSKLQDLLRLKHDPILSAFFTGAYDVLRAEVGVLEETRRKQIPRFSSLTHLVALQRQAHLHPSLDQALSCTYQLGCFISQCGQNGGLYPTPSDSLIIGLCTGSLAAAAVSSCRTLSELLAVAVHTVRIAFRTGLCAVHLGSSIEQDTPDFPISWSANFHGLSDETACNTLAEFAQQNHLSTTSQPYISVTSDNSITISGPPTVLSKLRTSPTFCGLRALPLPVYAPYHAPQLFSNYDIDSILETTSVATWSVYRTSLPVLSNATGGLISAGNYLCSLRAALESILLERVHWGTLLRGISLFASSPITVHSIGSTAEIALWSFLKQQGHSVTSLSELDCYVTQQAPSSFVKPRHDDSTSISKSSRDTKNSSGKSKIAIIGMSGRFPGAQDPAAFWDLLNQGLDVHKVVPPSRWDSAAHVDSTGKRKNTSATPYGCWLDDAGLFDAKFFNVSPREAPNVDPAQRIALMTAYEAIEQAGLVSESTPSTQKDRVGVFYGVTSNDWMETNSAQGIDTYFIPGGNRAFIPGRINYFFKFSGPSYSIDTACSSSLAAIHMACNALWQGDIDTAIAGGTNILTNPDFTAGLDRGHFLSRTGNCKTFDDEADGYCRGEGVGTVILKRLEDSIVDNDPIQGVILDAYTNHSAEAESITHPHVGAQKAIFDKILNSTGTDPYTISYVEMHGTGTQAGDNGEMQSVLETFAPATSRYKRRDDQALYLGSAKANVGHGEAAAGVTSLAKVLLMMKNNTIPPHCGIKSKINHRFPTDLQERNVFIARKPKPWRRPENGVRRIFVNNFSAAGGNSALLLEDAPLDIDNNDTDPRSSHVVTVSAKCAGSLQKNAESLLSFLDQANQVEASLPRLSYTTTARRIHHPHRIAINGSELHEIKSKLRQAIDRGDGVSRPISAPKIVFGFTGQGSQYPGMGRTLLENFSSFRSNIYRFDQIAQSQGFPTIVPMLRGLDNESGEHNPLVVQVATVCLEMALAQLWISWGVTPHLVVGHSLGGYAALNAAGVLSDSDTIYLVGKRAHLLQEKCQRGTHSMLAVKSSLADVQRALAGQEYEVACINGPEDTVLSGKNSDLHEIQKILTTERLKTTTLQVPYAFHSSQVDPILEEFEVIAKSVMFHAPTIPVACPLNAKIISHAEAFGPKYLSSHCRNPVKMLDAICTMKESGIVSEKSLVIEIGPQSIISGMFKAALGPQIGTISSLQRKKDTWVLLTNALSTLYTAGVHVVWREYHRDFQSCHKVLPLPAYSWDLKDYWIQYVNDWSLRKGDPVAFKDGPGPLQGTPTLGSTTIHKVVEERGSDRGCFIAVEADIGRADLHPLVQGHKVNGIPLCTPSVYAEIALSLGTYVLDRYKLENKNRLVDVGDMTIEKALVANAQGTQLIRASIEVDWVEEKASCHFYSVDVAGQKIAQHSHCTLRFRNKSEELQKLQSKVSAVEARMANLRKKVQGNEAYRFNQSMIYKMVGTVAQFDPNYRALDEIILDSDAMEATSHVDFVNVKKGGVFHTHPAFIDGLSQSGGFVMNANDKTNLDLEVFVNHGWGSFQLFEALSPTEKYQTHVKMFEKPNKLWEGDIMVLNKSRVVAYFGSVKLQGVAKRLLYYILSSDNGSKSSNKPKQGNEKSSPARTINQKIKATSYVQVPSLGLPPAAERVSSHGNSDAPNFHGPTDAPTNGKPVSHIIPRALSIISEESGIAVEDLTDNSVFADIGVDSLLSILISSRFKEELDIDADASTFAELPTIKHLKDFLQSVTQATSPSIQPEPTSDRDILTELSTQQQKITNFSESSQESSPSISTPETGPQINFGDADFDQAMQILSEESGIALSELTDDSVFADVGVDSLLSLIVVSRFSEELSENVSIDPSILADYPSVGALRSYFSGAEDLPTNMIIPDVASNTSPVSCSTIQETLDVKQPSISRSEVLTVPMRKEMQITDESASTRLATSVLLQGRPSGTFNGLILFPDGAGSASSYAKLPPVNRDLSIMALNCPYARHPEEMNCALDKLIDMYLVEIRRHQPLGPYNLGGWSAGGIMAYRAAQKLIAEGQVVQNLILIDSPAPEGLDRLPQRWYDHCSSVGLFGKAMPGRKETAPPSWLVPHFNKTIDVLHDFYADPLPQGSVPRTSIIWASECVFDGVEFPKLPPGPDDSEGMRFLTEKRRDFSAGGWKRLFPGGEVRVDVLDGAHHFSMMQGEHAKRLSELLDKAIK